MKNSIDGTNPRFETVESKNLCPTGRESDQKSSLPEAWIDGFPLSPFLVSNIRIALIYFIHFSLQ